MRRTPPWVWLTFAGFCVMWGALGSQFLPAARVHDFLNLYTGASLAREGRFAELHDPAVQLERERRIVPRLPALVPFVRPAFYAAILMPLAFLPYQTAFAVWITAQSLLLVACWLWGLRRFGPDAIIFGVLYLPCPLGVASGQDCVVMLALFIIAFELAERRRWFSAGAALALMLMKFHLILLWPVALLVQRRWRMLAGFCLTASVLLAACVALGGLRSLQVYAALLRNKNLDHLAPSPELMVSYQGLLANLGVGGTVAIAAIISATILVFLGSLRTTLPLHRLFALTALASLWIVPHVYGYDASLLLLPIWLVIFRSAQPASRIVATLLSTPLPFGFAVAGKPWAIVSSALIAVFLFLIAIEKPSVAVAQHLERESFGGGGGSRTRVRKSPQ